MRRFSLFSLWLVCAIFLTPAYAILNLELTQGVSGAMPIAIVPFDVQGLNPSQDIAAIIVNDLQNSGRFKVFDEKKLSELPKTLTTVEFPYFKKVGADNLVIGSISQLADGNYTISFQLLDVYKGVNSKDAPMKSVMVEQKYIFMNRIVQN